MSVNSIRKNEWDYVIGRSNLAKEPLPDIRSFEGGWTGKKEQKAYI